MYRFGVSSVNRLPFEAVKRYFLHLIRGGDFVKVTGKCPMKKKVLMFITLEKTFIVLKNPV
jgi:hypothetical protein